MLLVSLGIRWLCYNFNMQPDEIVRYWVTGSADDWQTVENLFDKQDNVHALFFAHLYLEKLLKALVVKHTQAHAPPKHGLNLIADRAGLSLTTKQKEFLRRVTDYNLNTRYPDYKFEIKKRISQEYCERELEQITEFGKWLKTMLKL